MQNTHDVAALAALTKQMRREVIEMITEAKSGHPGGSLSAAEIVATLFFDVMRHDPANPKWPDRDRFILSKGHCCPILYAVMAECGYCPKDQLNTLRKLGSIYQGHPDVRFLPALEASTGSLGQGLSLANGMGLAARLDQRPSRTYVVFGDGEIQEGQIWEAAMFASYNHLDNLVAIVDYNRIQLDGFVKDILDLEPLVAKWQSFGWHVIELDGHDIAALQRAFAEAASVKAKPTCLIAHTIKGKGVSFMENNPKFHATFARSDRNDRGRFTLSKGTAARSTTRSLRRRHGVRRTCCGDPGPCREEASRTRQPARGLRPYGIQNLRDEPEYCGLPLDIEVDDCRLVIGGKGGFIRRDRAQGLAILKQQRAKGLAGRIERGRLSRVQSKLLHQLIFKCLDRGGAVIQARDIEQDEAKIAGLRERRYRRRRRKWRSLRRGGLCKADARNHQGGENYVTHISPISEYNYWLGAATQRRTPSNEDCPPTLTVRFESTTFWPAGNPLGSTQAGVPGGIGGTVKFTWYSPTYPGVAPA
jgi:transketolase